MIGTPGTWFSISAKDKKPRVNLGSVSKDNYSYGRKSLKEIDSHYITAR